MKEHKIEILCQMEYEDWRKTNPMDWNKNDVSRELSRLEGIGKFQHEYFASAQANIQTGLGYGLGEYRKCFFCGK